MTDYKKLHDAQSIAWEWGQGVTDAETAIRKLHKLFPIDGEIAEKVEPMTARDELLAMAREAKFIFPETNEDSFTCWIEELERFHALAVAKEREECAKVCDCYVVEDSPVNGDARLCAKTIRARNAK